jgi:hypothetical protein
MAEIAPAMTLQEFAESKGFAPDLLARYGVRAAWDRIEIPYYDLTGNEAARFQVRYEDGKQAWNRAQGAILPYGLQRPVPYDAYLLIVEGASDCWACWANGIPALGIPGATSTGCLHADQIGEVHEVVIVREPDEAGSRFPLRVARRLRETGFAGSLSVCSFAPYKDPRAALIGAPAGFTAFWQGVYAARMRLLEDASRAILPTVLSTGAFLTSDDQIDYLIDGLLPVGGSMLLGAQKKVGKSTFLLNLVQAVSRGTSFLGRATRAGRVLYISVDEPKAITKARALALGLTPDDQQIEWVLDRRVPADWNRWLRDLCSKARYDLLVIDTLAKLTGVDDINSYGEWNRKLAPLHALAEELSLSWVGTHHNRKDSQGGTNSVAGSMAITAGVDTIVIEQKLLGGVRTIETEQRYGIDLEPTVLQMNDATYAITLGDAAWLARIKAICQKILFRLGDGRDYSASALIDDLHLRRSDLFMALDRLIAEGMISKPSPGRYRLTDTIFDLAKLREPAEPREPPERPEPPELWEP